MDLELIIDKLREMGLEKVHVKGQNVMCVCPFHPDRNPSFGIHPDKGGNCFACNTKFSSADSTLQAIAEKRGFDYTPIYDEIPFDYDFWPEEEPDPEPLNPKVLSLYKEDDDYFVENWKISREVVKYRRLLRDSFSEAECFPIFDARDNYWGMVERYPATDTHRSYYHYPPGFPRRHILLGEDKAEKEEVWIVEGVRDLCAVEHKMGVSAVALGGAKASDEQIKKIDKFHKVILALDNDKAGRDGRDYLLRNLPAGDTYVAKYEGKDPMDAPSFEVRNSSIFQLDFSTS
jgi:DNA primase